MKKSYNSFESIVHDSTSISVFLENYENYLAHTNKIEKQLPETLLEHINKVNNYFLLISKVHDLDSVVDEMINTITKSTYFPNQELVGNFIKKLFVRSIIFHDYGKVNPNFQLYKMKNNVHFKQDRKLKIGSHHSSLSAYIFIHWHLNESFETELMKINSDERILLWSAIFLFASPIFKHHSKYLNFKKIPFNQDEYDNLKSFVEKFKINSKMPLENSFKEKFLNDIFDSITKSSNSYNLFNLFALTKLSFSLLTASDYYATFDYTNGNSGEKLTLKVDDFGIIDKNLRQKIIQNFKTVKCYNKELFEKTEEFNSISFKDLQEKSNFKLNQLRQKLGAEALTTIRTNPNSNLFYLEAPTGGGKTNISLALAIELLEKNENINKIFYVFPFTTLITQTFDAIKETLNIGNENIIQLHSKSGFHQPNEETNDGNYGENRMNFIANHFINYPITLLTNIKFFDILKGNDKENNYIFHRLANSIVIIDELQTYNPKHWDKVIFFLSNYARLFNIKVILMSATLPKIDELLDENSEMRGKVTHLISPLNKTQFFQNPNFSGRVEFDFSILEKQNWKKPKEEEKQFYLEELAQKVIQESEKYAATNSNSVRTLIEFITKKTAAKFLKLIKEKEELEGYIFYLISGEILDPRRRQIIKAIRENKDRKVILITTQVVEAGVDIDMDLGFKDRSLIDSDEQLAGRVNRNASKNNCKVFMFDFDSESAIYRKDSRLEVEAMDKTKQLEYQTILKTKDFDTDFYDIVKSNIIKTNSNDSVQNLSNYLSNFNRFDFDSINRQFKLIEQENESIFVPLSISKENFSEEDINVLSYFEIEDEYNEKGILCINGETVWNKYVEILSKTNQDKKERKNYMENQILFKQIYGILSKFMFSTFTNQIKLLEPYFDNGEGFNDYKGFGIYYFSNWEEIYSYENGLDMQKVKDGDGFFL